jgi:hypothetical protein
MRIETTLARTLGPFDRPWHWVLFSCACVALDHLTGPFTEFPIAFVLPVAFAAWHRGLVWALPFAWLLPASRLLLGESPALPLGVAAVNTLVQVAVLTVLAALVEAVRRQIRGLEKEVDVLSGLLPICMYCKKIRDEEGEWQRLEGYIAARSEASFSHGICPECEAREHPG